MGGKRQTKDKAYVTAQGACFRVLRRPACPADAVCAASEWATEWGGAKDVQSRPLVRLAFNCCALTFTPFGACAWATRATEVELRFAALRPAACALTSFAFPCAQRTRCAPTTVPASTC